MLFSELKTILESNILPVLMKRIKEWIVFLMQPFSSHFCKKKKRKTQNVQKKAREALCLWTLSLSVRREGGGGGHLQAPQQPCVTQQGHPATSSPLGLQPQHSKPPS